jgi:hypothetical protein
VRDLEARAGLRGKEMERPKLGAIAVESELLVLVDLLVAARWKRKEVGIGI